MEAHLTKEELAELLSDGESYAEEQKQPFESEGPHGQVSPIATAVTVKLNDGSEIESKAYASAYTSLGIYAKGVHSAMDDKERYFVVPYESLKYMEFDMENIEEQITAAAAELTERMGEHLDKKKEEQDEPDNTEDEQPTT